MAHVEAKERAALAALEPVLANAEAVMGFVPNSMLTMAHMPQLTMAFSMLTGVVFGGDLKTMMARFADIVPEDAAAGEALTPGQVQLIAYCVSLAAGCRYCQAHTSHNAHRSGISEDKLNDVLRYESSERFSAAEKSLIGVALAAGEVPNSAGAEHFSALQAHFTTRQIVQVVAVIALFGFLNRWNDTMATQLEALPVAFAEKALAASDWQIGKHTSA